MSPPMTTEAMQFPIQAQFPQGSYPMMNPYGQAYMPPTDMHNFQQTQFNPDVFQMYMQLQMQNFGPGMPGVVPGVQGGGFQGMSGVQAVPVTLPAHDIAQTESETSQMPAQMHQNPQQGDSRDSGTDTTTPPLSAQQPENLASPHVSPHYPAPVHSQMAHMTPMSAPNSDEQYNNNNQTPVQQTSEVSPYAINNLLSTQSSPVDGNEEKEDTTLRRNTLPSVTSAFSRKRRSKVSDEPPVQQRIPPNFTSNYTPMMMQNFAALMDPFYQRRDLCAICADNATGYHYGVMSCEGCKGFFRRSVHKKIEYVCQKGQACTFSFENCSMNRGTRTRCQACRYKRCIEMGMNKENVRVTTEKEKIIKEEITSSSNITFEIKELIDSFLMSMPSSSHLTSLNNALEAIKKFIQNVPQMKAVFPFGDSEFDATVQKVMSGLLVIRVAFTFDPVSFNGFDNNRYMSAVTTLRTGIRNTVFTDNEVALLSGIFILQTVNKGEANIFPLYCQGLREQFAQTHPLELGIYDRLLPKLGPNLIQ